MKQMLLFTLLTLVGSLQPLAGAPQEDPEDNLVFMLGENAGNAWLGVKIRDLNAAELDEISAMDDLGVYISEILADSPAEKAGLEKGDIIVRLAGIPVIGAEHFIQMIRSSASGRTFTIEFLRQGKNRTAKVTLAEKSRDRRYRYFSPSGAVIPEIPQPSSPRLFDFFSYRNRPRLGIYYEDITEQLARFLGVEEGTGVLITSVIKDSPAEKAGLRAGDVIVRIDDTAVENSGDLMAALQENDPSAVLKVRVVRKGERLEFEISPQKQERSQRRGRLSI
ncbi:MAG: PDZ domain-containing protein [Acidobacteria bacterium]|nr:PDZ domain-containing protein [Acidobacteriota bacterium]